MKRFFLRRIELLLFALCFFSPVITFAQAPCGNIIAPTDVNYPAIDIVTTPIGNCADPFNKTTDVVSPYTLRIDGGVIQEGDTISVSEDGVNNYRVDGLPLLTGVNHAFFLHDGDDYRFVDTALSSPQEADYRTLAEAFFAAGTDIAPYVAAMLDRSLVYDMDDATQNLFWEYTDYIDQNFHPQLPFLRAGTYTLVSKEYELQLVQETFLEKLAALIIPTAHAQLFREYNFTITFTIIEESLPPTGISNILFLPGIQASRLYVDEGGEERKLWEPTGDSDIELLRMADTGESMYDVYTKEVVDELGDVAIGGNIYKGFLEYLENVDGETGPQVRSFPYDWRRDVFDIVENGTKDETGLMKNPVSTLEYLATISPTKKATLIAHSNGGLLAKAIMLKLEEEGKADLVDKVIFIATPHIGTPKGLAAVLHGYDQEILSGIISSDEKVRSVMKNMPGVYGLLPSEMYVDQLTEPMISFDDSATTKQYRDAYGFTISNIDEYSRFLNGTEGRVDAGNNINEPSTVNRTMLENSLQKHRDMLDSWSAPEGVEVFNIVGTGLKTPKSIEYREFMDVQCDGGGVCPVKLKIEPVLHFTNYGDQTVVSKSSGIQGIVNRYVDMKPLNKFKHANITEAETVQTLVDHILHSSSTEGIEFVTNSEPTFSTNSDILTMHSPARMYLKDSIGRITGRTEVEGIWKSEIPGSNYLEAGGVKYVIVPSDISYEVVIEGEGEGIYTHELKQLQGDTEVPQHSLTASVTPSTIATYQKTGSEFSNIRVDMNGDGNIDIEMTQDGKIIEKIVTYTDLKNAIRALVLPKNHKTALLNLVTQAEKLGLHREKKIMRAAEKVILVVIQKSVEQFEKKKMITAIERQGIDQIINKLIK